MRAAPIAVPLAGLVLSLPVQGASDRTLSMSWTGYRDRFVEEDGRVVDPADGGKTTSEGQAYAMIRAVWANDRDAFERTHRWSVAHLQQGDPGRLPAWLYGRSEGGTLGVRDAQPAADADLWMALALLSASRRWHEPGWRDDALALLESVWREEVRTVGGVPVLMPGPWAMEMDPVRVNPSYWLTFAYRVFAEVDHAHPWASLAPPAFDYLDRCAVPRGLPPDWCWIRVGDGQVVAAPPGRQADEDFGFDAWRVAWNLAADARWFGARDARRLLRPYDALAKSWMSTGTLPAVHGRDGRPRVTWEHDAAFGALLPAWGLVSPTAAEQVVTLKVRGRISLDGLGYADDYYGQNWLWFGYALWSGVAAIPEVG